ncbi:UDP-N-acetylenolpyruvoylglucosamine reductase [Saccharopolyspora rectivirgula]|jgi:UDP-N-acetylmuramate dehydrogenase|uniref:UDP-N-acetylenolpyruvoylglucosamine reductase n=1 Tax=Saccharopolyspora rectivirgula TaxID=28042 RepID=A0A073AZX8_9PSEU|nr:UDP-N-acetylenolpyruvoylglucosamine reductase [Saccharopolyspora rectivirgula]
MVRRLPLAIVNPSTSGAEQARRENPRPGEPTSQRVPLANHTTLRLGGPPAELVVAERPEEIADAVRAADAAGKRLLVLGGGSNVVIGDAGFDGLVVRIATRGCSYDSISDGRVQLTVEAGEDWDDVVADTVRKGLGGLECLSGIPGLTGATPVQNVGAYGVEVAERLVSVDLLDRRSGQVRTVPAEDLGLAYRSSVLKHNDEAVVLRVRFLLRDDGLSEPIKYAELARTLGVEPGEQVGVAEAREAVLELRRGKGMLLDPEDRDTWSAGSFFTNPVVPPDEVDAVLARIRERVGPEQRIPQFPAPGGTKLSAAWLIERAGFPKGYPGEEAPVRLSTKHTLALTNRGGATTEDLLALAREVRDGVRKAFGVSLVPEPVLVDCSLE